MSNEAAQLRDQMAQSVEALRVQYEGFNTQMRTLQARVHSAANECPLSGTGKEAALTTLQTRSRPRGERCLWAHTIEETQGANEELKLRVEQLALELGAANQQIQALNMSPARGVTPCVECVALQIQVDQLQTRHRLASGACRQEQTQNSSRTCLSWKNRQPGERKRATWIAPRFNRILSVCKPGFIPWGNGI